MSSPGVSLRLLVVAPGAMLGGCGLALLVNADDFDVGMYVVIVGHVVLGASGYLVYGPDDLRQRTFDWSGARLLAWVLALEVVFGALLFPATLTDGMDPDYSWFAVVPAVVVFVGGGSALVAFVVGLLVVTPVRMIISGLRASPGRDPGSQQAILLGLIVLWILPVSVGMALGTGQSARRAGGLIGMTGYLLGIRPALQPTWLWVARIGVIAIVVLVVLYRLVARRRDPVSRS